MEVLIIILVLIGLVIAMMEMNDIIKTNNIKVAYIKKHNETLVNQVNSLTLQNDNLMTMITILDNRIKDLEGK